MLAAYFLLSPISDDITETHHLLVVITGALAVAG